MIFGDGVGRANFCRNWYLLWIPPVAKDKLFPLISTFADGYGPNNDPLKGYILIFFISLICVLIGDLNAVSALLSNFFVASYALMNFAVFHASITNTPGWRPSFKVRYLSAFSPIIFCRLCSLRSKKYSALSYHIYTRVPVFLQMKVDKIQPKKKILPFYFIRQIAIHI